MKSSIHRSLPSCLAMLALAAAATQAQAQWLGQDYATYGAPMSNFIANSAMNTNTMIDAAAAQSKAEARRAQPLRADAAPQPRRNARELAQRFPEAQRGKMEQAYLQSFDAYRQLESKLGWPSNDVAGALATFVVGNYMVLSGSEVPDEQFSAVAVQLRANPGMAAALGGQGRDGLRTMYEQSAMVGTFMALAQLSLKLQPQPPAQRANLRESARANLQLVLGTDPQRLRINARGMSLE